MLVYGKCEYFVMQMLYFVSCVHHVAVRNAGVNRVQVVLSGFSMRLFCFVQTKTFCRYGCIYLLAALELVCVDVMVMSSAYVTT